MDDNRHQVSTSNSSTFLCSKPGKTNIKNQMEPGDATSSKYGDALLKEKILRVLSGTYKSSDIIFLYTNENFLYDPSIISYYEDETEMKSNIYNEAKNVPKDAAVEATVSLVYLPMEQHAELVALMKKKNILQRIWKHIQSSLGCIKRRED